MATLTAHRSVDNSGKLDLDLATTANVSENDLNHDVQYTSGTVHLDLHSTLNDLQFAAGVFFAGTIDTVTETKAGQPSYELSGAVFKLEDFYNAQTGNFLTGFVNNLFQTNDHIDGSKQSDVLFGFIGDDTIDGSKGADVISGGPGLDKLTGGKGGDTFLFDAIPDGTSADRITDFTHGKDTLAFSAGLFSSLNTGTDHIKGKFFHVGKHAADNNDFLIYNNHNGKLFYDHDANGSDDQVLIATLQHHPDLSSHDLHLVI